jgi:hypothetical protein
LRISLRLHLQLQSSKKLGAVAAIFRPISFIAMNGWKQKYYGNASKDEIDVHQTQVNTRRSGKTIPAGMLIGPIH